MIKSIEKQLDECRSGLRKANHRSDNFRKQLLEENALRLEAERQVGELRTALEDANSLCRSCYQVVERIAVVEGDVAFGSAFGRLQQALRDSLERQHKVMFLNTTSTEGKDHE